MPTVVVNVFEFQFVRTSRECRSGAPLLRRHIREKRAESFRHRRMCEDGIAQVRTWSARQHSHLYHGHGLAGFGAYHRNAKNVVVAGGDKRLHKALSLVDRVRPKHGTLMRSRGS